EIIMTTDTTRPGHAGESVVDKPVTLAADVTPEEYDLMRPSLNGGRTVAMRGRTGVLAFERIKVGFGTLYRVTVTTGGGAAARAVAAGIGRGRRAVETQVGDPPGDPLRAVRPA